MFQDMLSISHVVKNCKNFSYRIVIKMSQIQRIVKISHITCFMACCLWVKRVKKIMNVNCFLQKDKELCMMEKEKYAN